MEKYESKQHRINRPVSQIYGVLSDFRNFTPIVQDKVDNWQATENSCSFRVQGIGMSLRIVDKEPGGFIKFTGDDGSPLDFTFWIQLKEVGPYDTRMRLVLHAELNMMMKMMIGSKLKDGIEQMAQQIAGAFNGVFPEGFNPAEYNMENFIPSDYLAGDAPIHTIPAESIDPEELPDELKDYPITFPDPSKPVS